MSAHDVPPPTVPIPFNKFLKIVAIVDAGNAQAQELLAELAGLGYEVEVATGYARDVEEDAAVGAYIGSVEGDRLEEARELGRRIRGAGFHTPLWALADARR